MLRTIALAAVLLAGPAAAQETKPQSQQKSDEEKGQGQEKAQGAKGSDQHSSDQKNTKGYGYGTPSGVEANSTAKQAGDPKRAPAKAEKQDEAGKSATQSHAGADAGTLTGRIVSAGKDRITIEAPDGMRDIQLTGRTQVRGEGRTSASQLERGDEVRVSFDPKEGVSVAKRIEVRASGSRGKQEDLTPPPGSSTPPGSTTSPSGTPTGPTPGTDTQGGTTAPGGSR